MSERPAFLLSLRPSRRKRRVVLGLLLLTLAAHLVVIDWLRHELPLVALLEEDDDSFMSVTLQPPPAPVMPAVKDLPPPPTADPSAPVAAVPKTETPVAAVPEAAPAPTPTPGPDATASTSISDAGLPVPAAAAAGAAGSETVTDSAAATASDSSPAPSAPALFDKVSLPPSAELKYAVVGLRNGNRITGHGKIKWQQDGQRYTLSGEVGALVFTLLSYKSVGDVGTIGLVPAIYAEKRIGRSQTNTHFHRERNSISFSASTEVYPAKGGEQDRSTWIWQLASLGRGDPGKFDAGLVFDMAVAGHKTLDGWRVYVNGRENVELPQGPVSTWRLSVIPGENSFDKQFDLWLAPDRDWYPVMLRHVDKAGNSVEMLLTEVKQ